MSESFSHWLRNLTPPAGEELPGSLDRAAYAAGQLSKPAKVLFADKLTFRLLRPELRACILQLCNVSYAGLGSVTRAVLMWLGCASSYCCL